MFARASKHPDEANTIYKEMNKKPEKGFKKDDYHESIKKI